jgi:hypothetical protein
MNKYHVSPEHMRTVRGVTYASNAEAIRAQQLWLLEFAGDVVSIARQVTFELGVPENKYRVDFVVTDKAGRQWAEEVKGYETSKFRRDKKLWKSYGPMPLHVLRLNRDGRSWAREVVGGGVKP